MNNYKQTPPEKKIVSEGHPALRQEASLIPKNEIKGEYIQNLITHMKKILAEQPDGVGLAAPQVGVPLQLFIVSGKVFLSEIDREKVYESEKAKKKHNIIIPKDLVCINPKIIKVSKEKKWMDGEGCLSVRWLYGKVQRSLRATIQATDEDGKEFTRGAGGLLAHIFQHEVDHLNGILFIDKAKDLQEFEPNK